eukprot:2558103-Rhodomonas_salina.2
MVTAGNAHSATSRRIGESAATPRRSRSCLREEGYCASMLNSTCFKAFASALALPGSTVNTQASRRTCAGKSRSSALRQRGGAHLPQRRDHRGFVLEGQLRAAPSAPALRARQRASEEEDAQQHTRIDAERV